MTRYLPPALLLLACGGDSDPAGLEPPDVLRVEAGWTFFVDCPERAGEPGRITQFAVSSVDSGTLTGTQFDQFRPTDGSVHMNDAVSHVSYSDGRVTYSEDASLEFEARSGTMEQPGPGRPPHPPDPNGYSADATEFCGWPAGTEWEHGPPIMTLAAP